MAKIFSFSSWISISCWFWTSVIFPEDDDDKNTTPSNKLSNLVPESSNLKSSIEYSDTNNQFFAKKRRSFIPSENNLDGGVTSETEDGKTKEHSGEESILASGNSDDSKKIFKNSAEPEGSGGPGTIRVSIFTIYFHKTMFRVLFGDMSHPMICMQLLI